MSRAPCGLGGWFNLSFTRNAVLILRLVVDCVDGGVFGFFTCAWWCLVFGVCCSSLRKLLFGVVSFLFGFGVCIGYGWLL